MKLRLILFLPIIFLAQHLAAQPFGNYASFDDVSYITTSKYKSFGYAITIEGWLRFCNDDKRSARIINMGNIEVQANQYGLTVKAGAVYNQTNSYIGLDLADGKWHHFSVCVIRSGSRYYWWYAIDGKMIRWKEERTSLKVLTPEITYIGAQSTHTASGAFQLDELRVSNIVRYPYEINKPLSTADYTPPKAEFWNDKHTILLAHFNDKEHPEYVESALAQVKGQGALGTTMTGRIEIRNHYQGIEKRGVKTTICAGDSLYMAGTGGLKYTWEPASLFPNPNNKGNWIHPQKSGYVKLNVFDTTFCESARDSIYITVLNTKFNVNLKSDTICLGDSSVVDEVQPTGATNFFWSSNDDHIPNPKSWKQVFKPTSTSTYYLNIFNGNCYEVYSHNVVVGSRHELHDNLEKPYSRLCLGDTLKLWVENSTDVSWTSNYHVPSPKSNSLEIKVNRPASATVFYKNRFGCPILDTFYHEPQDRVSAGADSVVCKGSKARIYALKNNRSYQWYSKSNPSISKSTYTNYAPPTSEWVYVESADYYGCKELDSAYIRLINQSDIKIKFGANNIVKCLDDTARIKVDCDFPIKWDFNNISVWKSIGDSILLNYQTYENQSVMATAKVNVHGCSPVSANVVVRNKKYLGDEKSFSSNPSVVCPGDTVQLTALTSDSFAWSYVPGAISKTDTAVISYKVDSAHYVTMLRYDPNGCVESHRRLMWFGTPDPIKFSTIPALCLGDSIEITADRKVDDDWKEIQWLPKRMVYEHSRKYYVKPDKDTVLVALWSPHPSNPGCNDTFKLNISVSNDLKAHTVADTTVVKGATLALSNGIAATGGIPDYTYRWFYLTPGLFRSNDAFFSEEAEPRIVVEQNAEVVLKATDKVGCQSSDTVEVKVQKPCAAEIVHSKKLNPVFSLRESLKPDWYLGDMQFMMLPNNQYIRRGSAFYFYSSDEFQPYDIYLRNASGLAMLTDTTILLSTEEAIYTIDHNRDTVLWAGKTNKKGTTGGNRLQARFTEIMDLEVNPAGEVYVLDNGKIRRIRRNGQVNDIKLPSANFTQFEVDSKGNIYLFHTTSTGGNFIHLIDSNGFTQKLYANTSAQKTTKDGIGASARIIEIKRIHLVNDTLLWFFDEGPFHLREYNILTRKFTTLVDVERSIGLIENAHEKSYTNPTEDYGRFAKSFDGKTVLSYMDNVYDVDWLPVLCRGDKANLIVKGGSSSATYNWSVGSSSSSISVAPLRTTTYAVEVKDNGCASVLSAQVYVDHADAGFSNIICYSDTLVLGNGHHPGQLQWIPSNVNNGLNYSAEVKVGDTTQPIKALWQRTNFCGVTVDSLHLQIHKPSGQLVKKLYEVCLGDSVRLTATGANTYKWLSRDLHVQTTDSFISYIPTKGSEVLVDMHDGNCASRDTAQIVLIEKKPLQVNVLSPSIPCIGDSMKISTNFNHVFWQPGKLFSDSLSRNPGVKLDKPELVSVTANSGCWIPAKATLIPDTSRIRILKPLDTLGFCKGDSIALHASKGFGNVIWSDGHTGNANVAFQTGFYSVSGNSVHGCYSKSDSIEVYEWNLPDTVLSFKNDTLWAPMGMRYRWFLDTALIDSNTRYHIPTSTGNYIVEVENAQGCTQTSQLKLIVVSSNVYHASQFGVYPNPTSSSFYITLPASAHASHISVMNMAGKMVWERSFNSSIGDQLLRMDCEDWKQGVYLITLTRSNSAPLLAKVVVE